MQNDNSNVELLQSNPQTSVVNNTNTVPQPNSLNNIVNQNIPANYSNTPVQTNVINSNGQAVNQPNSSVPLDKNGRAKRPVNNYRYTIINGVEKKNLVLLMPKVKVTFVISYYL